MNSGKVSYQELEEKIRLLEERITALTRHDPVTGLHNKKAFLERLQEGLIHAARYGNTKSILLIRLRRLDDVQQKFGDRIADAFIQWIARRLKNLFRESDYLARIGRREFAVILGNPFKAAPEAVRQKILTALSPPFHLNGTRIECVSLAVGIGSYPKDGEGIDSLLRHAADDASAFDATERKRYMEGSGSMPYGTWKSPITSDLIVSESIGLGQIVLDGEDVYWLEMRPSEGGRYVVVRMGIDGSVEEVNPAPFNARTRVHEYGGGGFTVYQGILYFSNYTDQRLYRIDRGEKARPVTPALPIRYADLSVDGIRNRLLCVCEDHTEAGPPKNTVAAVDLKTGGVRHLVSGNDFYASPRLSPDGSRLAWLTWNHPDMPWDGTELWVAPVEETGGLGEPERIAGGSTESIFQPEWGADGALFFISDRSGWWNLYKRGRGETSCLLEMEADFGLPQWVFGMSTYQPASGNGLVCSFTQEGIWRLARIDAVTGEMENLRIPYTDVDFVRVFGNQVFFLGASHAEPRSLVRLDLMNHRMTVLKRAFDNTIDPGYLSAPEPVVFPTTGDQIAHGFFYRPENKDFDPPDGEKPPLLVFSHGGPTAAASAAFNLMIQYWTSRGIAVLDVNYGGSTGFGRQYRERLRGNWGVVDVDDCTNGARFLVNRGDVDGDRLAIRGGSAGGYTTLAVLTFRDLFKAGASYFGVSDPEALARETHKFESRYLDGLIGPYPERRDLYIERAPLHSAHRLSCPVIFLQGLEDEIVPANQAEKMVEILKDKGIPVAYLAFEGEQHGFRRSENIKRALDAEFYFYARIFGYTPADPIEPVPIANL